MLTSVSDNLSWITSEIFVCCTYILNKKRGGRELDILEIQKSVNTLLQNDWVKVLALPLLGGIYFFVKYFLERKIEGKPDAEHIAQLSQLADLKAKLEKDGTTLDELQGFRAKALGMSASIAIVTAQQYTEAASQLVVDAESAENDPDWEQQLSQTDMNHMSGEKAALAEEQLAKVIYNKIRVLEGEDLLLLQQSQAAWESFRTTETKRESRRWDGGTIRPFMVNLRYEAITRERIASLSAEDKVDNAGNVAVVISPTPRNLLQHIVPGVPKSRVQEILGTPSFVSVNQWYYRYMETQVQISFNDVDATDDVIVVLLHDHIYLGSSPGYVTDIPLGKLTLADVLAFDEQLTVQYRTSMRTQEVYVHGRIGPAGAWTNFCFGALTVFSGAGLLQEAQFEWDDEVGCLRTDPKDVLINWMALPTSSHEAPFFDWFIQ